MLSFTTRTGNGGAIYTTFRIDMAAARPVTPFPAPSVAGERANQFPVFSSASVVNHCRCVFSHQITILHLH